MNPAMGKDSNFAAEFFTNLENPFMSSAKANTNRQETFRGGDFIAHGAASLTSIDISGFYLLSVTSLWALRARYLYVTSLESSISLWTTTVKETQEIELLIREISFLPIFFFHKWHDLNRCYKRVYNNYHA